MRHDKIRTAASPLFYLVILLFSQTISGQQFELWPKTVAASGWTPWYEIHADPENANNMILCGSRWDAKDNASYGFVYSSSDGGNSWRTAMEDKNSVWVTEQSCSFGVNRVAYFVSAASKVLDGENRHELGTTRIYVSHDSGKTWKIGTTTGWTDWSTAVVDVTPGPNQNRLYVFFNGLWTFNNSIGNNEAADAERQATDNNTRVGMVSFKDGDTHVAGPFTNAEMAKEAFRGSYPGPAMRLKDGSIVSFYTSKRRNRDNVREFLAEVVRVDPARTGLEAPVHVATSVERRDEKPRVECGGLYLGSAAAYDADHDKLYYVYSDVHDNRCQLLISSSADGGRSWSKVQALWSPDETRERTYASPAIAVNKEGVLVVLWQEKFRSGCWRFAVSTDEGKSLSRSQELGGCSPESSKPSALSNPYLWTSFSQAGPGEKSGAARINLRNARGALWRNAHAIAVTPDGAFHPVWIESGNGEGRIRTTRLQVTPAATMISSAALGLQEVTDRVAVLYGGNQLFDPKTGILTVNTVVRNNSDQPLKAPFKLAVMNLGNAVGETEIANADNKGTEAGAVWDVSQSVPGGMLAPGATSKPFSLKFKYLVDPNLERKGDDIFGLSVKVFARTGGRE